MPTLFEVLTSGGPWWATPGKYSSLRTLKLASDGTGGVLYGYGQTICAKIACRFTASEPDQVELEYLESPPYQLFRGFRPHDGNHRKTLRATLTSGRFVFTEAMTDHSRQFRWQLDLNDSPYPEGLIFPYSMPTIFFGHGERIPRIRVGAEPGAAAARPRE